MPIQTHDDGGSLVAASSPLDSHVNITTEERTPLQHLSPLLDAISVASGVKSTLECIEWMDSTVSFAHSPHVSNGEQQGQSRAMP